MAPSPRARQALADYAQQKVDADAVMRALIEHDDWHVPVHALTRPPAVPPIVYAEQSQVAPHQLNVFTDRFIRVATGVDDGFAPEQPERAGNDEIPPEAVPTETADEERSQVLKDLESRHDVSRQARVHDAPILNRTAVYHPDRAARRENVVGEKKRTDHPL